MQKVVGGVLDPGRLKAALAGQEAVISSPGSGATGPFKSLNNADRITHAANVYVPTGAEFDNGICNGR